MIISTFIMCHEFLAVSFPSYKMKKNVSTYMKAVVMMVFILFLFAVKTQAQLSGAVYKDFDSNGSRTLPNEIGVSNVLVSAYVGASVVPVTTRTDINGNYSFTATDVPAGSKVRVEFTELGISFSGKKGAESGSSVQFVTGGSTNVNLGLISSDEFCLVDGLELFASCYVNGDPLAGGNAGEDAALVRFPYTANGLAGANGAPYPTMVAKAKEIGAVWGTDYQKSSKTAIVSAIVRRHSGLGPLGTGGIYKVDFNTDVVSPLVDLKSLGIDTGPDPHTGLPANMEVPNEDSLTIYAVAKTGIGGITLSRDEKTLYVVNLYDRTVYSMLIGKPASTPNASSVKSFPIPDPCGDGDYRPWAIKQYGGKIYVGVVCTAETSQDSTKLKAVIYQLEPSTGVYTKFYEFPLDYKKGPLDHTGACINYTYWKPWVNTFPNGCASFFDGTHTVNFAMYPSAILTDIEFDGDGSMLVGFMDRHGLMAGFRNMRPKDDGMRYDGFVGGDILRIYNDNGVYRMENNGVAGNRTGSGVGNDQGPGGGEFYGNDYWKFYGNPAHSEIVNGGLLIMPGTGEVVASAMDPVDEVYQAAGMKVFSNFDGSTKRGYALYSNRVGTLGKSGGSGDFKSACGVAPIEIGNRVWYDKDFDGIQDPDEDGIEGVTVTLHDKQNGGVQVASTTTGVGGVYCFSDANLVDGLLAEHQYELRIHLPQSSLSNNKFYNISPKDKNSGTDSDLRDSDASLVGDYMIVPFTTGLDGETNHALDFGLIKCIAPNAGTDLTLCEPAVTEQLPASGVDNRWKFVSGPAVAAIDSLTGKITNLAANGTYKFMLYYSPAGLSCSDSISIKRNAKPVTIDKIGNNGFCFPIDTTTLSATPIGGTWSALATNPAAATIDNNGKVLGMTKIGIYSFVYTTPEGCKDTANVEIKACCVKPNAGTDVSLCQPASTYDFPDVSTYNRWAMLSGPSIAEIDSLTGKVTGMIAAGEYRFLLYYSPSGISCSDTVSITIKPKPNAGIDKIGAEALCLPVSNFQLSGTPTGGVWSASSSNTEVINISSTGLISAISKAGFYDFIYTLNGCADTVRIETKACPVGKIGDLVWVDRNKDGLQSPDEQGIVGVKVELYAANDTGKVSNVPLVIKYTDAFGRYLFDNLPSGKYILRFVSTTVPIEFTLSPKLRIGFDENIDNDAHPMTGETDICEIDTTNPLKTVRLSMDAGIEQGCLTSSGNSCAKITFKKIK